MGNKIGRRRQVVDDKYTRPQGLYQHRDIDHKKLRKLILESKLAPCYPGTEECALDLEECPICFLYYPSLNRSRCCMKRICTECFLQMKPPDSTRPTQCPFCKTSNYAVEYRGVKTKEEKGMEEVEEQKVIEAQIRIRQQEIQDEAKSLKKRQDISSSIRIMNPEQEVQDEPKRLKKRQDISSSSRIMNPAEVEYCNIGSTSLSAPSFKCTTQTNDFVSSQASCSMPAGVLPSHSRQNRADNFDLDLDDIMVMEAIWLSIQQEHGYQGYPAYLGSFLPEPSFSDECYNSHGMAPLEVSPYGGLACAAAAAVTERQHINFQPAANIPGSTTSVFDMLHRSGSLPAGNMRFVQNNPSGHWTEIPPDCVEREVLMREEFGKCSTDYWSYMTEAGMTSYAGSGVDPETAAYPFPASAIMVPGPESFEEQMMLAMSVSQADSRGRTTTTTTQGVTWL